MSKYCRVEKICLQCSKTMMVAPSVIRRGGGKYCSSICKANFLWGNPEYRKHMSDAHRGQIPTNLRELTAYSKSDEGRKKNSERQLGKIPWNKGIGGYRDSNGYAFVIGNTKKREHRDVVEKVIGRDLKEKEVVHHWNKVKKDNREENLCLFRSQSPHKRLHHFADRHGIEIKQLRFEQPWLKKADAQTSAQCSS